MSAIAVSYPRPGIARLELASPATRNALGSLVLKDLAAAIAEVEASDARVVVVTAQGDHFSVGGDLGCFAQHLDGDLPALVRADAVHIRDAFDRLFHMEAAVIVGAQGIIAGGALGLILSADMAVLADDARLNFAYSRIGASPDAGTSWHLPRIVGHQKAYELLALSETIDARTAVELRLAARLVTSANLEATVTTLAEQLIAVPPVTLSNIKRLLRHSTEAEFGAHLVQELNGFEAAVRQPEFRQRVSRWAQK